MVNLNISGRVALSQMKKKWGEMFFIMGQVVLDGGECYGLMVRVITGELHLRLISHRPKGAA